ncbi:HAD family hydrolase [Halalkalibacter urbisdiaboli]|uniref:HAD family hydrolase n=1 Tax=Halalkalibacter urbisdiaboli TaxID=1960589 RepID=UPI000B442934|nr:HAD family hydrolase [Halalkalibacter urbisdiaboli]
MNWMKEIKVAIFDLDGTLYQDYSFLERYLTYLFKESHSHQEIQQIISEAYDILEGNHVIKFGHFIDKKRQISFPYINDGVAANIYSWGKKEQIIAEILSPFNDIEDENMLYLGDPWGIAAFYIEKHNIDKRKGVETFNKVRKEMLLSPFSIQRYELLFKAIEEMNVEKKTLMTNTPLPSAYEFITYLGIENLFNDYVYDAKKPIGIQLYVERLLEQGYLAEQILSIGDNPWNDLYPVQRLGGRGCLISKYKHANLSTRPDFTVTGIEQLTDFLTETKVKINS